ncbi:MAG: MFS transporter [Arthrobacter sp.]
MARKRKGDKDPKDHGVAYSFRAFKHRNFSRFWLGALVSNIGGWLSNLAVPFVLYDITGSAVWVGLASVAQFVPGVLLGPLGGALADRYDRRRVLLATQVGMAISALLLWGVWASGIHDPLVLLILVALIGSFGGVNMPSWQSFVSDLVPRADLMSAVTLNSLQFNAARSLGPAIAGLLIASLGPSWAFLLNGISFVFVIVSLLVIKLPKHVVSTEARVPVMRQFGTALGYVKRQKGILLAVLLSVVVGVLGNPMFSLTVVFASDVFGVDALGLGLLNAALGFGALLAAPVVAGWSKQLPPSAVVKWGLVLYGVSLMAFGTVDSYWLGVGLLVVVGACFLAVVSGINTAVQLIVADHMRGRAIAVRHVFYTLSFPIGSMLQGAIADVWGVQVSVIIAGAAMIVCVLTVLAFRSKITFANLDDAHDEGGTEHTLGVAA